MQEKHHNGKLPWASGSLPLMLAPMQGLTNRALRGLFIERVRPDVVFTEFVRVKASTKKNITENDRQEVVSTVGGVPLVVQLIGTDTEALVAAANTVQELGAEHLNINLGCPYGRMTSQTAGGALLREPVALGRLLARLRQEIRGSFSVKVRSGFDDPAQIFSLLALFGDSGIDFLVVHPRTVKQMYSGAADHGVTGEVVRQTFLPVIANGDVFNSAVGRRVLAETGAAGLMLGRGAIADPLLFERLRGRCPSESTPAGKVAELREYLQALLACYQPLFCGEHQILCKMKEVLCHVHDPEVLSLARQLKRSKSLAQFKDLTADG
ncbi:MAG: tRNA-dihydrouridine synthase family protein [Deltaproteobacteria bacterium]|nr:tRNA-dihydrouridine synthase family protein [Deltaproteobacteria bacterium]